MAGNTPQLYDLIRGDRNRGTTTFTDLLKTGRKRPRPDYDFLTDDEMVDADDVSQPSAVLPGPPTELPSPLLPEVPVAGTVAPASGAPPAVPLAMSEPEPPPSEHEHSSRKAQLAQLLLWRRHVGVRLF